MSATPQATEWPPIVERIESVRQEVAQARRANRTIGFVPTMGALHAGHAALIQRARKECGYVVVSIFVNPTQFGPQEDFARYPRTLAADRKLCAEEGADLIFAPSVEEMYPPPYRTFVEVTELDQVLCGASRPKHFRGVCTVVLKLLQIVQPDVVYFGEKDYQQARIIRQMIHDLNVPVHMEVVPTVREADGLACSSPQQLSDRCATAGCPADLPSPVGASPASPRRGTRGSTSGNAATRGVVGDSGSPRGITPTLWMRTPCNLWSKWTGPRWLLWPCFWGLPA
jgi:cytidyltransferase-like protein